MTSNVDNKNGWQRAKCQPRATPARSLSSRFTHIDCQHFASALISAVPPNLLPLPPSNSLCRPSTHLADAAVSYVFFPPFSFYFPLLLRSSPHHSHSRCLSRPCSAWLVRIFPFLLLLLFTVSSQSFAFLL